LIGNRLQSGDGASVTKENSTMKYTGSCGLLLGAALAMVVIAPASAHHSFAQTFDRNRPVVAQVVVTAIRWENPHTLISVDLTNKSGKVESWTFESFPPGVLWRKGLRRDRMKPGAKATFKGFGAADGTNFAHLSVVEFPDGESFCVQFPGAAEPVGDAAFDGCTGSETGQYRQ
jgi:hypothetical protein